LYGSFNCMLYDGQRPVPYVVRSPLLPPLAPPLASAGGDGEGDGAAAAAAEQELLFASTLWGPTCDSVDYVYKGCLLPDLRVGDWLLFPRAGAYTVAGACEFNGIAMTAPAVRHIFSATPVDVDDA
jgi:ornithine decarboxylase